MAAKAEALVIIIDVGVSMNYAEEGGEQNALEKSITAVNMIIQRKIFSDTKKNKDEAALILFGTDGTSNKLHDDAGEGYEHVTVAKEMGVMDLELLKFVNNQIVAGNSSGDFIDALVVAVDHLHTKCMGRKMEQKIILFSNMESEFGADQLEMIVNGMKANNVNLIFVGPDIDDDDDDDDDNEGGPGGSGVGRRKPLSPQQVRGINCMRHILDEVDGEGMSLSEVLPLLSFFETRRRKQVTTFRGPIEIGTSLKINSYAYVKTSEEKPASWKKLSALAETAANRDTMKVEMQRSFHLNDEDQTEVNKENTAQAFRYGKTLVPMTSDDQKSLKLQTTKGCLVLGFTSQKNIERHHFSRNGCHIFTAQPDDEHAAVAFSALCHALVEKEMVAIVRYVARGNTDPKVGFLAPHIKSSYESLIFVALPYREDLRQYQFAPLEGGKNKPPTQEQLDAIDCLIDTMGLVKSVIVDEEEEKEELYKPKNILNPITQRQCQCIQSRALNPEEDRIPEIEEYISRSIKVLPEVATNCNASFEKIKEKFPLEVVESNKTKSTSNVFANSEDEPSNKKKKTDNEDEAFTFSSLSINQITEVGIVNPIGDFSVLIEKCDEARFHEVCKQLSEVIKRLVMDSFLDQYYPKALECLKKFKDEAIKRKVASVFNQLLHDLKEETFGKRRHEFWELIAKENIGPISQSHAADSSFSDEQADKFFKETEKEPAKAEEEEAPVEDEEDLLDMM